MTCGNRNNKHYLCKLKKLQKSFKRAPLSPVASPEPLLWSAATPFVSNFTQNTPPPYHARLAWRSCALFKPRGARYQIPALAAAGSSCCSLLLFLCKRRRSSTPPNPSISASIAAAEWLEIWLLLRRFWSWTWLRISSELRSEL